jgi:hypothetical protein
MRRRRAACVAAAAALACAGAVGAAPSVAREQKIYPGSATNDASLAPGWSNFSWRGAYDLNSTAVPPFRGAACAQATAQLYGALSFYTRAAFSGAFACVPVRAPVCVPACAGCGAAPARCALRALQQACVQRRRAAGQRARRARTPPPLHNAQPATRLALTRASANAAPTPPAGPTAADGWDAVDFWMRGRDALSITVFVLPAASSAAASGASAASVATPSAVTLTPVETVGRPAAALAVDASPFSAGRAARGGAATARGTAALRVLFAHTREGHRTDPSAYRARARPRRRAAPSRRASRRP